MFESVDANPPLAFGRWLAPAPAWLHARWLFLRALGAIFFSAFYALWFQIDGLIGPEGILPAGAWLLMAREALGIRALWLAPTILWINAGDAMLNAIVIAGLIASVMLTLNLAPRISIAVAVVCFMSFVTAAQDFSAYQSDGMLLEAGFLSLFLAPPGLRPGLGVTHPPSRISVFLLQYEWFRIYFESGLVKLLSGEPQWRDLTAMDKYYENGPLPTWLGWYVQQWPHSFHAFSAAATLIVELFVVWLLFFGRRSRWIAFAITTPLQIGIILTANYAFLNYLVLVLGFLLLEEGSEVARLRGFAASATTQPRNLATALVLSVHFITTTAMFFLPGFPTARLLAPSRIVNSFGLFAVMTRARYEIEFQGTADGRTWIAYPFAYKPQDPMKRPGIFAPYQPRFDWNLWFASLASWEENRWVLNVEARLLQGSPPVLRLFGGNPFANKPPVAVRSVLWQYWFTKQGERGWWRRELKGGFAPMAVRTPQGDVTFQ
jgi:lipase maturation factor 1